MVARIGGLRNQPQIAHPGLEIELEDVVVRPEFGIVARRNLAQVSRLDDVGISVAAGVDRAERSKAAVGKLDEAEPDIGRDIDEGEARCIWRAERGVVEIGRASCRERVCLYV